MAGLTFHPDLSAEVLDDASADGKPKAGTHRVAGTAGTNLVELLEDLLVLVGRDARSIVGDANGDCAVRLGQADADPAGSGRRELLRV